MTEQLTLFPKEKIRWIYINGTKTIYQSPEQRKRIFATIERNGKHLIAAAKKEKDD